MSGLVATTLLWARLDDDTTVRVEEGDPLPDSVTDDEVLRLSAAGAVVEAEEGDVATAADPGEQPGEDATAGGERPVVAEGTGPGDVDSDGPPLAEAPATDAPITAGSKEASGSSRRRSGSTPA